MRGAALVECAVAGVPFAVVGTHLGTDAGERPVHARLLRTAMADLRGPVILGADLNDEPGGPAWSVLAAGLVDAAAAAAVPAGGATAGTAVPEAAAGPPPVAPVPTYSCGDPRRRIDAIFTDPRITVAAYEVLDTPAARRASDHFPVVADLRLPA
jgi:endonuclease/exonuclease/phosphatase family metal-dependent hydrolase